MSDIMGLQKVALLCGTVVFVAGLQFLRRYLELRHERSLRTPSDLTQRLDRIEAAVETTALEIERLSESNRFISKLLADRADPMPMLNRPERAITPH